MKNPRRMLFVCNANRHRSPTAERIFGDMLTEAGYRVFGVHSVSGFDAEVISAGIDADDDRQMSEEPGERMDDISMPLCNPRINWFGMSRKVACLSIG